MFWRPFLPLVCLLGFAHFLSGEEIPRNLPQQVDGLALWLRADHGVSLHESGGNGTVVRGWKPKAGGQSLSANQSAGDWLNRALQTVEQGDSKPTIHFLGNSSLQVPSSFNLKNSSVFVTIKHSGGDPFQRILSFPPLSGTDYEKDDGLAFLVHSEHAFKATVESRGLRAIAPDYNYAREGQGIWMVLGYRIDGLGNMTASANGVPGVTARNPNMASANSGGRLLIGHSPQNQEKENLDEARIYEILIFNRYLSDDENARLANYMRASLDAFVPKIVAYPTASAIDGNATLSSSALSGGLAVASDNSTVSGNFTWTNPETRVARSGNQSATFVPDSANHAEVEFPVFVTVKPQLNATPGVLNFSVPSGIASEVETLVLEGSNLTANVSVGLGGDQTFEISGDGVSFAKSLSIPPSDGAMNKTIHVRVGNFALAGNHSANLNIKSGTATRSVSLNAVVSPEGTAEILCDPQSLSGFSAVSGTASTAQTVTVRAYNLTSNLSVAASEGWQVSSDNSTFAGALVIPAPGASWNGTIHVRMDGSGTAGDRVGNATVSNEAVPAIPISLTGNLQPSPTPTPTPTPTRPAEAPKIISPSRSVSFKSGKVVNYQIRATGNPVSYSVSRLPSGLRLDSSRGTISGVPGRSGVFKSVITVSNAAGSDQKSVTFKIRPGKGRGNTSSQANGGKKSKSKPVPVAVSGSTWIMSDGSIRRIEQ